VAEANGKVVGLMGISDDVEVASLADNFNLAPFGGLVKASRVAKPKGQAAPAEAKDSDGAKEVAHFLATTAATEASRPPTGEVKAEASARNTGEMKAEASARNTGEMKAEDKDVTAESKEGDGAEAEAKEGEAVAEAKDDAKEDAKEEEAVVAPKAEEKADVAAASVAGDGEEEEGEEGPKKGIVLADEAPLEESIVNPNAGQPNAFSVTLFCIDGKFESRAADFLPHAFQCFPDREYCILTVKGSTLGRDDHLVALERVVSSCHVSGGCEKRARATL
jgi:hypothetical protein